MSLKGILPSIALIVLVLINPQASTAQVRLLAIGSLTDSRAGHYADLSGLNNTLENGAAANLLGGLGSGIAGMAGVALSQIGNVSPNLGTIYIVDSFMVVVFGGVGNLMGTLVGAL